MKYSDQFRKFASEFYDVDQAEAFFSSPVPEGFERWRCVLCGWGCDCDPEQLKTVGACCCGGCGQTTLRPIAECTGLRSMEEHDEA